MKPRIFAGAAMAALVLPMGLALSMSMPSAAAAATGSGSAKYVCSISDGVDRTGQVEVRVDLTTAGSVPAGERTSMAGQVMVKLPDSISQSARWSFATKAALSSESMFLAVKVGNKSSKVPFAFASGKERVNRQLVYTAPISLSDIAVPSDASGSVDVSLPGSFKGLLSLDGVVRKRNLACSLPPSANPRIASVPVIKQTEAPAPEPSDSGTGDSGTGGGESGTGGGAVPSNGVPGSAGTPQSPDTQSAAPGSGGLPSSVFSPPTSSAPGRNSLLPVGPDGESPVPLPPGVKGEERAETADVAYAGLPPQTDGDAASLPTQIVVGVIALLVLGGLGIAVPARLHLMRVREEVA